MVETGISRNSVIIQERKKGLTKTKRQHNMAR